MQIEIVAENSYARKVLVTVPAEAVSSELARAVREFTQRARVPGFRVGKVPPRVVEERFGASLANDVAEHFVQKGWTTALLEKGIEPVGRPSLVERGKVRSGQPFTFTIGVDVRPEVQLGTYTGLPVVWPAFVVAEAEVDGLLERRRASQARLVAVEDRPVGVGDTVQVELEAKDGDEVVLSEPGTLVRTVGESWLTGLGDHLVGLSIGESRTGAVTFDEAARNSDVAGRTLEVTAKVLSIQALETPALDDALARELGAESVEALRASVKEDLAQRRGEQSKNQARANLLQALLDANTFDVPEGMVDQHLQMLLEEVKLQNAYRGVDPKELRFSERQVAELRTRAVFAARGGLLLEAVARAESIAVSEAEVEARVAELASERGQSVDTVRGWFEEDGGLEALRARMLEEKTIDWLLDHAAVTHEAPAAEAAASEAVASEPAAKPKKASSKKKAEASGSTTAAAEPAAAAAEPAAAVAEPAAAEPAPEPEAKPKKASAKKKAE